MEARKRDRIALTGGVDWYHGSSVVRDIREGTEIDIREVATALCHIPSRLDQSTKIPDKILALNRGIGCSRRDPGPFEPPPPLSSRFELS